MGFCGEGRRSEVQKRPDEKSEHRAQGAPPTRDPAHPKAPPPPSPSHPEPRPAHLNSPPSQTPPRPSPAFPGLAPKLSPPRATAQLRGTSQAPSITHAARQREKRRQDRKGAAPGYSGATACARDRKWSDVTRRRAGEPAAPPPCRPSRPSGPCAAAAGATPLRFPYEASAPPSCCQAPPLPPFQAAAAPARGLPAPPAGTRLKPPLPGERLRATSAAMLGLTRNAVVGLNLYCGGAGLAAGGGGRKEPRGGRSDAAEGPDAATPARGWLFRPGRCSAPPPLPEEAAAAAMLSPEAELDGDEPALRLAGAKAEAEAGAAGGGADGDGDADADALYRLSLDIISRYLREQASGRKDAAPPGPAGRRALDTLRRVGDGVQRNHRAAFQGMLRKLDPKGEADVRALARVMAHVFSDGVTNWGRVATLIAFGAFAAKHLHSTGRERCVEPLARSIADVLVGTKRDWLVQQRGWDGFVEFFHVEDLESGVRNVLLAFAGVAGVGAGLAYLIR
ncbi:induced myeloid leukemia cell differentiation protein Mcl-1 [Suncus etruscus]|uniref:induced myeloid leukemia cell differentiation protein Mcl-1 n=1 Tax=Suncus etruscus TaxID=109475 RepID=UPI00210FF4CC|nr:induced myeloid leukemia cell differentiation protein Mcl-1 [Suncus etruscus]